MSATGQVKQGHPDGELNITRACGRTGIIQMVSSAASYSYSEIVEARITESQPLFFQLYLLRGERAPDRVREAERLGYKAIYLTVDAPVRGNRELDLRAPFVLADQEREAERVARKQANPDAPMDPEIDYEKGIGEPVARLVGVDEDMTWEKVCIGR